MRAEEYIQKAYSSILQSDFEQAIEWFEQAIALDNDNPAYHYKLSITYARSNKLSKALEHAGIAVKLDADHEEYRLHLQYLQAKQRMLEAEKLLNHSIHEAHIAKLLLKEAIALDPLAKEAYVLLAMVFAELNDYQQAILTIKEAIKLDPHDMMIQNLLSQYKEHLKEYLET